MHAVARDAALQSSALEHQPDAVGIKRLAAFIEIASRCQLGADLAERAALSGLGRRPPQPLGHIHGLREGLHEFRLVLPLGALDPRLATLAFAPLATDAVACMADL